MARDQCDCCGREAYDMDLCARCRNAWYCTKECLRLDWPEHKKICQLRHSSGEVALLRWAENLKPRIFHLSLEEDSKVDICNGDLFSDIQSRAVLVVGRDKKESTAERKITLPYLTAVLVTDAAILKDEYSRLHQLLVSFAKSGGRVVFAFDFPRDADTLEMNDFFQLHWQQPWTAGSRYRTTYCRVSNVACNLSGHEKLPTSYSMEARQLRKVQSGCAVYMKLGRAVAGGWTPADSVEAAVAFAPVEKGFVGFIGDVKGEPVASEQNRGHVDRRQLRTRPPMS